jgi:hypothetical protein
MQGDVGNFMRKDGGHSARVTSEVVTYLDKELIACAKLDTPRLL